MKYEMFDIIDAVMDFWLPDIYIVARGLFSALGYPIDTLTERINVDPRTFVYLVAENDVRLSEDEITYLNYVDTISFLFRFNDGARFQSKSMDNAGGRLSMVFLAVDLQASTDYRSEIATCLTGLLNRCFNSLVFVVYRRGENIMFSGEIDPSIHEESSDIYLSDWISTMHPSTESIEQIYSLSFYDVCLGSMQDMYFNMLYAISRKYQVYPESWELLQYGLYYNEYSTYDYDEFRHVLIPRHDRGSVTEEIAVKREYYQELYGSDYVYENTRSHYDQDDSQYEDEDIPYQLDEGDDLRDIDEERQDDIDEVDESYFDDPIRLLEYLNEDF